MHNINENEDYFLKDLSDSLADQVKEGLEQEDIERRRKMSEMRKKRKKKKKNIFFRVILVVILLLLTSGAFLTLTPAGRKILTRLAVEYMYSRMDTENKDTKKKTKDNKDTKGSEVVEEEELVKGEITENIDLSEMSDTFKNALHEEGVYNLLLLGVESVYDKNDAHGRTDSIMIATINTKQKTLGLTSLMRDSVVKIPGYKDNRINAAYALGGVPLMYETIAENYGLRLDGSAIVGFDSFQQVIDDLGGVEIELTEGEAQYLNTTNYISKKKNRNVKPGKNILNGNQALGYARVRYRKSIDGSADDFGRTSRHRRIMNAIFQKMKKANPASLIKVMNTVLPKVKTDVSKSNAASYLAELLELSIEGVPLDNLRLPENGAYWRLQANGIDAIGVDFEKTRLSLLNFVFGSHKKEEAEKKDEKKDTKKETP